MSNDLHILAESLHDGSIWSDVEEEIDWCFHDAVDHVVVNLFVSLVNEKS